MQSPTSVCQRDIHLLEAVLHKQTTPKATIGWLNSHRLFSLKHIGNSFMDVNMLCYVYLTNCLHIRQIHHTVHLRIVLFDLLLINLIVKNKNKNRK